MNFPKPGDLTFRIPYIRTLNIKEETGSKAKNTVITKPDTV
jgi:hypothetical protein